MEINLNQIFRFLVGLLVLELYCFLASDAFIQSKCKLDYLRLPRHFEPDNYKLYIEPNLDTINFDGSVAITLHVNQIEPGTASNLSEIILHAEKGLRVIYADFEMPKKGDNIMATEICRDSSNDLMKITLERALEPGSRGDLRIVFEGLIRGDKHGLYRSPYGEEGKFVAMTQFQAPHARKAFPCFDEPDFKATFELVIEHDRHLKALSNMPAIDEIDYTLYSGGKILDVKKVTFAKTPRMSTYLLAYAIGEFDNIERTASNGMPMSVWVEPGKAQLAWSWINTVVRAYPKVQQYFGIEQPITKIDFVCLRELDASAMENWGLIAVSHASCYFEDRQEIRTLERIKIYNVAAHELSHGWIGNLVTMRWWDNLWLNEGFATLLAIVINQQLYPEQHFDLVFLLESLDLAFDLDADESETHPIRNVELQTAEEIERSFDHITYEKSSAVLHMLMRYLGPETLQSGIRNYVNKYRYGNTEEEDLWRELNAASNLNVSELMTSWIDQEGHPLVTVTLSEDGRHLHLAQERFGSDSEQKWIIPISLLVSDGSEWNIENKTALFSEQQHTIELPGWFDASNSRHWIKLNKNFCGFYRVVYQDKRLFEALELPIRDKILPAADRFNIISDALALFSIGKLDSNQIGQLLNWYEKEDDDLVVNYLSRKYDTIKKFSADNGQQSKWVQLFISYYLATGGFRNNQSDNLLRKDTRKSVLSRIVELGETEVVQNALNGLRAEDIGANVASYLVISIKAIIKQSGTPEQKARAQQF